jgi:hypothetical protein
MPRPRSKPTLDGFTQDQKHKEIEGCELADMFFSNEPKRTNRKTYTATPRTMCSPTPMDILNISHLSGRRLARIRR